MPQAYLILGPSGAGRRLVLADLIGNGLDDDAVPVLLSSEGETAIDAAAESQLSAIEQLVRRTWSDRGTGRMEAEIGSEVTDVFVLADGRANPADQVELFHEWLKSSGCELGRIITVVDCTLGHRHPETRRWFDACVHFSDVVLLNRRSGVPNVWISDFTGRLRKEHFPCLVELVKHDEVENPALLLEPQARRISTFFDDPADWPELDDDEEEDGEIDSLGAADPYLERMPSGRRMKEVPDIRALLDSPGE